MSRRNALRTLVVPAFILICAGSVAACGDDEATRASGSSTTSKAGDSAAPTASSGGSVKSGSTLTAVTGPDFNITLQDADGKDVSKVEAGQYTIEVDDRSDIHNFHLTGPGVEETTSVEEVGKKTWKLSFKSGTYDYVCDPHQAAMKGSFTVA